MFRKNVKIIFGILTKAYLDNMEILGNLYIKSKNTIDHLEGEAFAEAWGKMKWEYQRKCAEDAISNLIENFGGSKERASTYYRTREVPGVDGQTEYLVQYMYPDYVYCIMYYILTGKKAKPTDAIYIDEDIKHMIKTWIRMWETNYKQQEPLYMGTNRSEMCY